MEEDQIAPEFTFKGVLEGHSNWVTAIVSGYSQKENEDSPVLVSGSRDKSLIIWKLFENDEEGKYGQAYRMLTGHSHFVSDLALS
jgi:guanine nucleotide-binding protein subunit beta-2-like 1 protein